MTVLKFALLLLNLHWSACGLFGSLPIPIPAKGNVRIRTIEPCETTDIAMHADVQFDTVRGDDRALSFTASFGSGFDESTTFTTVADKWMDDAWFLNFYSKDGYICEILRQWFTKIWPQLAKAIVPNLENDCPHPAGNYSLEKFELSKDTLTFPALLYGLYRITLKTFNEDGENFMCIIMTLDISLF